MREPIRWPVATATMAATPTAVLVAWWALSFVSAYGAALVLIGGSLALGLSLLSARRGTVRSVGVGLATGCGAVISVPFVIGPLSALGVLLGGGQA
ncbi:hypothetical protein [Nocardioides zeae]|uniref:Uncharacterized protein n=1 Tax=Nocardioides zeae TaxID=1457234 RepID=A0AAJ1X559_9ACTN|nr:hypothetical protein [Nocardioides zeae]MDQ1106327.1 hypothetical protein [Nocardioides zeae]